MPPCVVSIEACASVHHWANEISAIGHNVRLVPHAYVKPRKNDAADADAVGKAASRPTMRFVEPKQLRQQARATGPFGRAWLHCMQGLSNHLDIQRLLDEGGHLVQVLDCTFQVVDHGASPFNILHKIKSERRFTLCNLPICSFDVCATSCFKRSQHNDNDDYKQSDYHAEPS